MFQSSIFRAVDLPEQHVPVRGRSRKKPGVSPSDRALNAIRAVVDALYQSARSVESRTGLTNAQLAILRQVVRHGPLSVNDIAAGVHAGQSAVSVVLGRLEDAKLVRRFKSTDDGRRVMVAATQTGTRMLRRSPRPPTERLLTALSQLSSSEAEQIADGLEALLGHMRRGAERSPMLFE